MNTSVNITFFKIIPVERLKIIYETKKRFFLTTLTTKIMLFYEELQNLIFFYFEV